MADPVNSSDKRRSDLMKAPKLELAEMYRSTFRPGNRPRLSSVLARWDKAGLAEQLLRLQDRVEASRG